MNATITNSSTYTSKVNGQTTYCLELQCGKRAAFITVNAGSGELTVLAINASHKARRASIGRPFASLDAALAAYKTGAMHTMIRAAWAEAATEALAV